jgi:hypothetical protein
MQRAGGEDTYRKDIYEEQPEERALPAGQG